MKTIPRGIRFPENIDDFVKKSMDEHNIRKFGTMVIKLLADLEKEINSKSNKNEK